MFGGDGWEEMRVVDYVLRSSITSICMSASIYTAQEVGSQSDIPLTDAHPSSMPTYLTKIHTLHTLRTKRRTNRRTRTRLARADNQLDNLILRQRLLRHGVYVEGYQWVA